MEKYVIVLSSGYTRGQLRGIQRSLLQRMPDDPLGNRKVLRFAFDPNDAGATKDYLGLPGDKPSYGSIIPLIWEADRFSGGTQNEKICSVQWISGFR